MLRMCQVRVATSRSLIVRSKTRRASENGVRATCKRARFCSGDVVIIIPYSKRHFVKNIRFQLG